VPAGAGGSIALSFRPAATYHLVLAASMLAVAILLALAAWSFTPAGRRGAASGGLRSGEGATTEGGASGAARRRAGRYSAWLGLLAVTALIFMAGGPVALVVPLLACLAWLLPRPPAGTADDRPGWVPWLALGGLVASGLLSAVRPFGEGLFGPFGWPAQACALVALAAALTPAVTLPVRRRPGGLEAATAATAATAPGEKDR
jgi:arabinofuranan 3-O-arabinosyltransferase